MIFALGATIIVALAALAAWAYERGTREYLELEVQRAQGAAYRWRRAYYGALVRTDHGKDA